MFAIACGDAGRLPSENGSGGGTDASPEPPAPSEVYVELDGDSIVVHWRAEVRSQTEALVYRALVFDEGGVRFRTELQLIEVVPSEAMMYRDRDVVRHSTYTYGVAIRSDAGASVVVEQTNAPVTPGGPHSEESPTLDGPVVIKRFEASPTGGSGAVTATFGWSFEEGAGEVLCRLDLGDGTMTEVADCARNASHVHTYSAEARGVMVATLTVIRSGHVSHAERGIALNLNPDESRYLAFVVQLDDGTPVKAPWVLGGNVRVVAVDRHGGTTNLFGYLDEHGSAVIGEFLEGHDGGPYTLFAMVSVAEDFGSVMTRIDDVRGPGTVYVNAEAPDLARVVVDMARTGYRASAAYVLAEDIDHTGAGPLAMCCMMFSSSQRWHVSHMAPGGYTLLVTGVAPTNGHFVVADELNVEGDRTLLIDPPVLPHGLLSIDTVTREGAPADNLLVSLRLKESSLWPPSSEPTGVSFGFRLQDRTSTELLLMPASYGPRVEFVIDDWWANIGVPFDIVIGEATTSEWRVGGRMDASLRVDDGSGPGDVPGTTVSAVRFVPIVVDAGGNVLTQVFRIEAGIEVEVRPLFRLSDPAGVEWILDGASDAYTPGGGYRYVMGDGALVGEYRIDVEWDVGPFADGPLLASGTFVIDESGLVVE